LRPHRKPVLTVTAEQADFILKIATVADQPADMLSDRQARDVYHVSRQRLAKAIGEFAPDSGIEMEVRNGRGVRTKLLRPRAAIGAALRGEHWTPPAEAPAELSEMPAADRTTEPKELRTELRTQKKNPKNQRKRSRHAYDAFSQEA